MSDSGTTLANAYVQILPTTKGIAGALQNSLGGAASDAGDAAGSTIASKIKGFIAAAGIGETLRQSIMEGANLQQSLGGIETLFKDSSAVVIESAKNAYKTAGMSANDYMETVTGFSASLLQSLGNDTEKAAGIADMALTDMSDNVNKFGTDMESIKYAYQGFAKQNYTMLDNLKLGYGGTKEEMQRLLADAEKLSGVKYDISSLSDVYNAIHVVQGELGVSGRTAEEVAAIAEKTGRIVEEQLGTTAKEAATTFSGSFSMMKAAAENALGNMALGEKIDFEGLASATSTFVFDNFLPMLGNIVSALPNIAMNIATYLPVFAEKGMELIESVVNGIVESIPQKLPEALSFVQQLGDNIAAKAPEFIERGFQLLGEFVDGIISALPILIENVPQIISTFANVINDNFPTILMKGVELIGKLIMGIISAIPTLIANIPQIISAIVDTIMAFNWLNMGKNIMTFFKEGIKNMKSTVTSNADDVGKSLLDKFKALPDKVKQIGKDIISGIWNGLSAKWNWLLDKVRKLANSIFESACEALGIHSPSTKFAWIAEMSTEGQAQGTEKGTSKVVNAVKKQQNSIVAAAEDASDNGFATTASKIGKGIAKVIIPVQVDGREIARATAEFTSEQLVWEAL